MKNLLYGLACLFTVLLGGVLVAPLPSEAHPPTLTIEIKDVTAGTAASTTTISLGGVTTCTSGGNYCYGLPTSDNTFYGTTRQFKIVNGDNQTAQVQVTDFGQSNCDFSQTTCDNLVLTGVKFVPVCGGTTCTSSQWPNNQKVTLKLTLNNVFNQQPGGAADGVSSFYMYGMSVGGYFSNNSIGDVSQVYGKGTFTQNCTDTNGNPITCPQVNISNPQNPDADLTVNPVGCKPDTTGHVPPQSPLCWTVAYPGGTTQLTFTNTQQQTFFPGSPSSNPTFGCTNNLQQSGNITVFDVLGNSITYKQPSCQPDVTVTYLFTLLGPDSVILSASGDNGGVGPCGGKKNPPCDCNNNNKPSACNALSKFINDHKNKTNALQVGIQPSGGCDPVVCSAGLNNELRITTALSNGQCLSTDFTHMVQCNKFRFIAAGPRVDNFEVEVNLTSGIGVFSFTGLISGTGGTEISITPDYPNWPMQPGATAQNPKFVAIDQANVFNGTTPVGPPDVVVNSCSGDKGPVFINAFPQFATYLNQMHGHNSTTPGQVCSQ